MKKKYQAVLTLVTVLSLNIKCNSVQKEKEHKTRFTFIDSAYADSIIRATDPVLNNKIDYGTRSAMYHYSN